MIKITIEYNPETKTNSGVVIETNQDIDRDDLADILLRAVDEVYYGMKLGTKLLVK